MNFFKSNLLLILYVAVTLLGCKSSQVGQTSKPDTSTNTAAVTKSDPQQDHETLTKDDLDDMMVVSSSIRQDLESYFESFSQLDIQDEDKRAHYLEKGLGYFQSSDTPVLIVVNQVNGQAVYDRPTSIEKYLDYLKHTRKNPHTIHNFELDEMGKISKLELILK